MGKTQPFIEASAADRIEYLKKRDEYFKHVNPAILREINKRRVAKGGRRIIRPRTHSEAQPPLNGFMRSIHFLR
jgi:hypothetical protein